MQYIGGISEMNYSPIQDYNNALKGSKSFNVPEGTASIANGGEQTNQNTFDQILTEQTEKVKEKNDMDNFMSKVSSSFSDGINSVNNDAIYADKTQEMLAAGEDISPHEVMIAAEKSNLSLQMALQIRNRLLNAYTEINSMQV